MTGKNIPPDPAAGVKGSSGAALINGDEMYKEVLRSMYAALTTYSNVHRGSGHFSMATTHLYDKAREIVLDYLGLDKGKFVVIFCTPLRASVLMSKLRAGTFHIVSGENTGLCFGVRALAVDKKSLPRGIPFQSGGGTAKLVSRKWAIWAEGPGRFEAGTPSIVNIIGFARALSLMKQYGNEIFRDITLQKLDVASILYHDDLENYSGHQLLDELRRKLIGNDIYVPTLKGPKPYINMDYGASTPTFMPVWNAFSLTLSQPQEVKKEVVDEVRAICADVLGAPLSEYDIIFTSNTTEAINLVARSILPGNGSDNENIIINTLLEHNSNDLPWRTADNSVPVRLMVDENGFIDTVQLDTLLNKYNQEGKSGNRRVRVVAMTGASNVLGVFNDPGEISRIVHKYGASLLVDAAQMVAHRKVEISHWGIDYLVFSAHKVYAPFGTGVLIVKKGLLDIPPDQMRSINSSGEENAGGIASLGKSLLLLKRAGLDVIREEEQAMTARALKGLAQIPGLTVYGINDSGSPSFACKGGVIAFSIRYIMPDKIGRELAQRGGIGIRYGCHCAHLLVKHLVHIPPALEQFQRIIAILFPGITFPGLARISLGIGIKSEDIDTLINVLMEIARPGRTTSAGTGGMPVISRAEVKDQINEFIEKVTRQVYGEQVAV